MFGVALDVRVSDLRDVLRRPKAPLIGIGAQFLLLPAGTFLLTRLLDPAPSIALGMILVACCPGGNVSNIITHLAKGNTGLSIGMTGVSTLAAAVLTPLNFAFWGSLHPDTDQLLRSVAVSPVELAITIGLLLAVPVTAGVTSGPTGPSWPQALPADAGHLDRVLPGCSSRSRSSATSSTSPRCSARSPWPSCCTTPSR
jgi:bile acid:Na+ symporter, BASS family